MSITLCIPTLNRSEFLIRLLNYYANTGYRHQIIIGDSSDQEHANRVKQAIKTLKLKLNVNYLECPNQSFTVCMENINQSISTPYCTHVSDDDFICPQGLNRCVEFLDENPDYISVQGKSLMLSLDRSGPFGEIQDVRDYPHSVLTATTGRDRFLEYITAGPLILDCSVHRLDAWREMYRGFGSTLAGRQSARFGELTSSSISAIQGKAKDLDCLYLIRQAHDGIYAQSNIFDWITDPDWHKAYRFFCDRVTEELARQDGVSADQSGDVIKRAFWPFLARQLTVYWQKYDQPPELKSWRRVGRRIPGSRKIWRRFRSLRNSMSTGISLQSLMRSSSRYHEDFMPVYKAITSPPAQEW